MVRASFASLVTALACTVLHAGCDTVVVETAISYDDRFPDTVIDVYRPPERLASGAAVLTIHGGGWRDGSDRTSMAAAAERLALAGYVAINVEYRRVPGGEFPRAVQDCLCALAFVRQHAASWQIDPARIAGFGYSAGGHLVSMLGTAADDPAVAPDCAAGTTGPLAAVASGAGIAGGNNGVALAALQRTVGTPLAAEAFSRLYRVNLTTGAATEIGQGIAGAALRGLAIRTGP